jgi:Domain of unknown function (DUF5666)
MRFLAALLLLATLVSCAGPASEPVDDATVVEPGTICRVRHNGGPVVAERGFGGTGAPGKTQLSDRGIGGTGIVGVVTGFASICVDGLEVRLDKTVPVSIDGSIATAKQLRVGQLVVIKAAGSATALDPVAQAQMISVRYEVSGPIEAIDLGSGAMIVAGQRVMALPTTWMAGHFGLGNWITVSGLRRSDGTIVASRLDRARVGTLAVRGQVTRERDTTSIGSLVLRGPAVATLKAGAFVSVAGRYRNGIADVTAIDDDLLSEDPTRYFGASSHQLIVQAFVRVERGMVSLSNGQRFRAEAAVQGQGTGYRNAIVWLERTANGSFTVTQTRYTNYRAQPKDVPSRAGGHGADDLVGPPDARPGPPTDVLPVGVPGGESDIDGATGTPPTLSPSDTPTSNAAPPRVDPLTDGAFIADQFAPRRTLPATIFAAN